MTRILAFSDMHLSRRCARDVVARAEFADLIVGAGDSMLTPALATAVLVPDIAESADELRAAAGPATVLHGESVRARG